MHIFKEIHQKYANNYYRCKGNKLFREMLQLRKIHGIYVTRY